MGTLALISLGSNVGDRLAHLNQAVDVLDRTPGVTVVAVSTSHETNPVGGPVGQGPFLNAAARLDTDLDPFALLDVLLDIERQAGRVRTVRWGERTLDLDLLLYGCKRIHSDRLILPHPRMAVRRFVLAPLAEIAPEIVDMQSGRTIFQMLEESRQPAELRRPRRGTRPAARRGLSRSDPGTTFDRPEGVEISPGSNLDRIDGPEVWLSPDWSPEAQAKVLKLRADGWRRRLGEDQWLVTDFCESKFVLGQRTLSLRAHWTVTVDRSA